MTGATARNGQEGENSVLFQKTARAGKKECSNAHVSRAFRAAAAEWHVPDVLCRWQQHQYWKTACEEPVPTYTQHDIVLAHPHTHALAYTHTRVRKLTPRLITITSLSMSAKMGSAALMFLSECKTLTWYRGAVQ